jgi:hypothetical protein
MAICIAEVSPLRPVEARFGLAEASLGYLAEVTAPG